MAISRVSKLPLFLSPSSSFIHPPVFLNSCSAHISGDEASPVPQAYDPALPTASPLSLRKGFDGIFWIGMAISQPIIDELLCTISAKHGGLCVDWPPLGPLTFLRRFTSKEIKRGTDGFSMILGSGSHGIIYKARFSDGLVASVKKARAFQQEKDIFYREVQLLGCLHHRHLVRLQGFSEGHDRFLVFDYMENGSLKEYLQNPLRTPLNWRTRLQIAIDVAAALEYLHYFCDPPLYNVSINSNNILLDENFVAKISDVSFLDYDCNLANGTDAASSEGHLDQRRRDVVFQFGVLILELITGQSLGGQDGELVQWVQKSGFTYSMHKMVDADLGDSYDSKELKSLLVVARLCTKIRDEAMISIPQILRYLQRKVETSVS